MIRTSSCSAGLYSYITAGRVRATPDTRRLEDELCDTKTIHRHWKSSNKNSSSMFSMCECLFYVCLRSHSRICVLFLYKLTWMSVFMCFFIFQFRFVWSVVVCVYMCVGVCACNYVSIYKLQSPTESLPHLRRGRSWRDWWRGLLARCLLLVWSNRNDCCPDRRVVKTPRSNRWESTHPAGRRWCPPIQCRGRSRMTWGPAPGGRRWETRP